MRIRIRKRLCVCGWVIVRMCVIECVCGWKSVKACEMETKSSLNGISKLFYCSCYCIANALALLFCKWDKSGVTNVSVCVQVWAHAPPQDSFYFYSTNKWCFSAGNSISSLFIHLHISRFIKLKIQKMRRTIGGDNRFPLNGKHFSSHKPNEVWRIYEIVMLNFITIWWVFCSHSEFQFDVIAKRTAWNRFGSVLLNMLDWGKIGESHAIMAGYCKLKFVMTYIKCME